MDADQPLKALFLVWTREILGLLGERGARVVSARVVELPAVRRSVDVVIRLRRRGDTYLRHVEFEMRHRRGLELRLFEYTARLAAHFRLPVLTTVVFLRPPAPERLAYCQKIAGTICHEWRFDVVRLWDRTPDELMAMGPGAAALVGCARAADEEHVRAAAQLIGRTTAPPERADLLYVLQALCAERYTAEDLARMIPREDAMAGGMFAKEFRQARAEGRAAGRAEVVRTCLDIVKHLHPKVLPQVAQTIEGCESLPRLRQWTVAATRLPAAQFVRLVSGTRAVARNSIRRKRAPRPSRRSTSRGRQSTERAR